MSKIGRLLEEFGEVAGLGNLNDDASMEIKKDKEDDTDITCFKIPIDYKKKPNSLVAHTELLIPTLEAALEYKQYQPLLQSYE